MNDLYDRTQVLGPARVSVRRGIWISSASKSHPEVDWEQLRAVEKGRPAL
ncbi:hypothetical protein ACWC91_39240 [Streptomyces sp. NPDC001204]